MIVAVLVGIGVWFVVALLVGLLLGALIRGSHDLRK